MRRLLLLIAWLLASCSLDGIGIDLAPGWRAQSMAVWRNMRPDMLALSPNGKWLYLSCETNAGLLTPSLAAINLQNGRTVILLNGLHRADGLKFAPDGSLWIGEEFDAGLIWRVTEADKLPDDQRVDRSTLEASDPAITPLHEAGAFAHEGFTFSLDSRYAYLADEWKEGCLYRYDMHSRKLEVLHPEKGWLAITEPEDARINAEKLHGRLFNRLEDMETLPDGRILMAETGTGRILLLDDRGESPAISVYLEKPELRHPDNLAWDAQRQWLWITDDDDPSRLWSWDGRNLTQIAKHEHAEITGVLVDRGTVYLNLQREIAGPELTVKLMENPDG